MLAEVFELLCVMLVVAVPVLGAMVFALLCDALPFIQERREETALRVRLLRRLVADAEADPDSPPAPTDV